MTTADAAGRKANRRGSATRENMLAAALTALATGDPAAVSANRIAKEAGATWGAVKYQFGDVDGFWAAVLRHTAERRGDLPFVGGVPVSLRERVVGFVETMYAGLLAPDSRAIENLRAALPRDHVELERAYPKTAAELASWRETWAALCQKAFADLGVDPVRVDEVAAFMPGAMRGIVSEHQLGTYSDLGVARRGLANAIVAYLDR